MHLSKLIISNFSSIKELASTTEKGKNIIVGEMNLPLVANDRFIGFICFTGYMGSILN